MIFSPALPHLPILTRGGGGAPSGGRGKNCPHKGNEQSWYTRRLNLEAKHTCLSCVLFFFGHAYTIPKQQHSKKKSYFWKKQLKQTLQNTQLQLEGLTPGCGVKSIFVINLSILISGSQRTRWCLCVYCATVGFPYFGGPLGQCLEPMYAQLLSEWKHRHRLEQHGDLHRR